MADREKVIKGLICCQRYDCESCPYYEEPGTLCGIYNDALELLKENESVKPISTDSGVRIEYNCGSCGKWFAYKSKIHPELDFRMKYCPHCGREVKWKCG